jgi:hypothetical protein
MNLETLTERGFEFCMFPIVQFTKDLDEMLPSTYILLMAFFFIFYFTNLYNLINKYILRLRKKDRKEVIYIFFKTRGMKTILSLVVYVLILCSANYTVKIRRITEIQKTVLQMYTPILEAVETFQDVSDVTLKDLLKEKSSTTRRDDIHRKLAQSQFFSLSFLYAMTQTFQITNSMIVQYDNPTLTKTWKNLNTMMLQFHTVSDTTLLDVYRRYRDSTSILDIDKSVYRYGSTAADVHKLTHHASALKKAQPLVINNDDDDDEDEDEPRSWDVKIRKSHYILSGGEHDVTIKIPKEYVSLLQIRTGVQQQRRDLTWYQLIDTTLQSFQDRLPTLKFLYTELKYIIESSEKTIDLILTSEKRKPDNLLEYLEYLKNFNQIFNEIFSAIFPTDTHHQHLLKGMDKIWNHIESDVNKPLTFSLSPVDTRHKFYYFTVSFPLTWTLTDILYILLYCLTSRRKTKKQSRRQHRLTLGQQRDTASVIPYSGDSSMSQRRQQLSIPSSPTTKTRKITLPKSKRNPPSQLSSPSRQTSLQVRRSPRLRHRYDI